MNEWHVFYFMGMVLSRKKAVLLIHVASIRLNEEYLSKSQYSVYLNCLPV